MARVRAGRAPHSTALAPPRFRHGFSVHLPARTGVGQPAVALSAMAFNAFLPMFLFISASVNNDTLVVLLSSIALVMMVRIVQRDASRGFMLALGIVVAWPA